MTTDGADFAAAVVVLAALAAVEALVPELLPQPANAAATMASAPTMYFIDIRFKFRFPCVGWSERTKLLASPNAALTSG